MPTLKDNLLNNKASILYYGGVFVVIVARSIVSNVLPLIPNTWWGLIVVDVLTYGLIFLTVVAPFIFGKGTLIDELKKTNEQLLIENEGYKITNKLANDLLAENGKNQVLYTPVNVIDVKKLPDPPSKLEIVK